MSGAATIMAIADNIASASRAAGVAVKPGGAIRPKDSSAGALPCHSLAYVGESFEHSHGQRPGYSLAEFRVATHMRGADYQGIMRGAQKLLHDLRGVLTVNALNSGALAASKPVSLVSTELAAMDEPAGAEGTAAVNIRIKVRYRVS